MIDNSGDIPPNQPSNPKADAKAAKAYAKASRPWYKKKRWWAAGVVVIFVIAGVASGSETDDEPTTASDSSQSEDSGSKSDDSGDDAKAEEPKEKPIKVEATQILKDFEDNEAAADGKYKGKTLEVSGVVAKVDTEVFDDEEYVVQIGGGSDFEFFTVNCDDQASEDVSSLSKGDDITVIGEFEDGGDLGVELKDCSIQ